MYKQAKTGTIIILTDANGSILATSDIIAGHHHDGFVIVERLKAILRTIRDLGLCLDGAYFNANSSFDTKTVWRLLWSGGLHRNIPKDKQNWNRLKCGRNRHFNHDIAKKRFTSERTFAWRYISMFTGTI